jgi:beta-lactamase superfamily II metal-dependent hydrolase
MKTTKLIMFMVSVLIASLFVPLGSEAQVRIVIFSVGQTDSQLIIGPDKTMLIDCGAEVSGSKNQYEYVADNIRTLTGGSKVDYFLISHYHYDHMGSAYPNSPTKGNGLWGLVDRENIQVGTVIDRGDETPYGEDTGPYKNYTARLSTWTSGHKVGARRSAKKGDVFDLGGNVHVQVVALNGNGVFDNPSADKADLLAAYAPSENDYSIALKLTLGNFEYFTGGDVTGQDAKRTFPGGGHTSYNDVESTFADLVGNVEVMKVSHHGSAFSTNQKFVDTLRPEFSIVSCGDNNPYEHPSQEVVDRLVAAGSKVLITSGVAKSHKSNADMVNMVVGHDIDIVVDADGAGYSVNNVRARSYSDAEEAAGLDHLQTAPVLAGVKPWRDAPSYIGSFVTLQGTIAHVRETEKVHSLSFSSQYWKDVNLVVFPERFDLFPNMESYNGKKILASGAISDYQGRPQIVLTNAQQLQIAQ